MLKIAEYSCACDALKDKIKRSLRDAGVQYDNRASEDDTVRIVFAGQYSAGKSTIIKMLTGNEDIATGAEITTQETQSYEWMGLEIVDTPGVHTSLRPDHDEISYKAIASADILVFVVTNELFDSYIAEHFRKLAIDKDKAGEMILVVNKMDRAARGNSAEQQEIIREGLRDVLAPYTPEQLHLSFIDAQSYLDSLEERETDPEIADELLERSGYDKFIETLNSFVAEKSLVSKLTTELYILDNVLDKTIAELEPGNSDADIDAFEENLIQQRHILIDARNRMQQEVEDIFTDAAANIRQLGLDAADLVGAKNDNNELEEKLAEYDRMATDIMDKCQADADDTVRSRLMDLGQSLDNMEKSEFSRNLKIRLVDKYDDLPEGVKKVFITATNIEKAGDMVLGTIARSGVPEMLDLTTSAVQTIQLTDSTQSLVRKSVSTLGRRFGSKVLARETAAGAGKTVAGISKGVSAASKGIARGSSVVSLVSIGIELMLQFKEDYDDKLLHEALKNNRQNIRSAFNTAASELEDYSRQYIKDNVFRPMEESVSSIEENIRDIRDTKNGRSELCLKFERFQTEIGDMIQTLHSIE
ncbi:MAG: 50S ribosome-binding GTPase [Saccharofermentans sp.]|nr:50S ribosome-binding GTPase [Saccharofermentans sp.]